MKIEYREFDSKPEVVRYINRYNIKRNNIESLLLDDENKKYELVYWSDNGTNICLTPLERNELEKAMFGRGLNYETIQLILNDFGARINRLYINKKLNELNRFLSEVKFKCID